MKTFLLISLVAALAACSNSGTVKSDLDSTVNKIRNSATMDSIESKGSRILDSVKSKGGELWDSTRSKGGKLLNRTEEKVDNLKKKDSVK